MTSAPETASTSPPRRRRRLVLWGIAILLIAGLGWLAPPAAYHLLPPGVMGEPGRLASVLGIVPGHEVAEIGAGAGALAKALAPRLEPGGTLYVTEIDATRLDELRDLGPPNIQVIEATATSTGLAPDCCDAIFMRKVYHHIGDTALFNQQLKQALRPGGRLAVIDFGPGTFTHLDEAPAGASPQRSGHGVSAGDVARELRTAGFEIERIDPEWGGWMYLVVARAPGPRQDAANR